MATTMRPRIAVTCMARRQSWRDGRLLNRRCVCVLCVCCVCVRACEERAGSKEEHVGRGLACGGCVWGLACGGLRVVGCIDAPEIQTLKDECLFLSYRAHAVRDGPPQSIFSRTPNLCPPHATFARSPNLCPRAQPPPHTQPSPRPTQLHPPRPTNHTHATQPDTLEACHAETLLMSQQPWGL
eukprot:22652-Chlamydomonas_euryale.AAC.1